MTVILRSGRAITLTPALAGVLALGLSACASPEEPPQRRTPVHGGRLWFRRQHVETAAAARAAARHVSSGQSASLVLDNSAVPASWVSGSAKRLAARMSSRSHSVPPI
jgi:hypothetical protein